MPLTKKQQLRISQLVAANRAASVACHVLEPTMQALFKYVGGLLKLAYDKGNSDQYEFGGLENPYDGGRIPRGSLK